jgi:formate hydrogenlyase subunit 6/NADH:ubiquinone oxidoreductase subunit I
MDGLSDGELYTLLQPNTGDHSLIFCCSLGQLEINKNQPFHQACHGDFQNPELSTLIKLPCLSILKESHLVAISLSGVDRVYLDISRCRGCFIQRGKKTIENTVSYAQNLLTAIGYGDRITLSYTPVRRPTKNFKRKRLKTKNIKAFPEYSRREFFSLLRGKAGETIAEYSAHNEVPEKRAVLVEALKIFNEGEGFFSIHINEGTFPIHQVEAGKGCTLCYSCELFCPTGALKRMEGDGEVRIDFQMSLCVGCYQCKELCPEGALYYRDSIDLTALIHNKVKTIMRKAKKDCPQCGRSYFPGDVLDECPTCRKRKDLDKRIFALLTGKPGI